MVPAGPIPLRRHPRPSPAVRRVLVAAPARPAVDRARVLLADLALVVVRRELTLLEVRDREGGELDTDALFGVLSAGLPPDAAAAVRVVVDDGVGGVSLATALTAPTLVEAMRSTAAIDVPRLLASARTRFRAVYQPVVDLSAGHAVVGYEALLRVDAPSGPVPVAPLFEAAAALGVGAELDDLARAAAWGGVARWLRGARLFVNTDPATVCDPAATAVRFARDARAVGLEPCDVVVELTERARVRDVPRLVDIAAALRRQGFAVALDDVGSGWSALDAVVQVQPEILKIEAHIVSGLPDPAATAVVRALVAIARSYGGAVVAEGIETVTQERAARELGVTLGQGHHLGRPEVPHEQPRRVLRPEPHPEPEVAAAG